MNDQNATQVCVPNGGPSERLSCLHIVVEALSSAYTVEEVAEVIITRGLSTLGGNAGSVSILTEDATEFETIRCVGFPKEIVEKYRRYPFDTHVPNADVVRSGKPLFVETRAERNRLYPWLGHGGTGDETQSSIQYRDRRGALAALPLVANGRPIGGLMLSFFGDHQFGDEDRTFLMLIADICAQALERARLYETAQKDIDERRRILEQQKQFLRDVLLAVTDGKLHLCHSEAELPKALPQAGTAITLTHESGLDALRHATLDAAKSIGFPVERSQDLMTAASEAGMNAIIHANGGVARICSNGDDLIQIWIEDRGHGIEVEDLPHATLMRGYSTAGTLGHGLKIILQTIDRLWLYTRHEGTTVVLEQCRDLPPDDIGAFPRA
jgi:anti-sigma regulatory factor (Ser/Thr protein kinase)